MTSIHTAYGEGRIVATENYGLGKKRYRVAGVGFDIWMDAAEISKTGSTPRDRAPDSWASSRDRGRAEHERQDLDPEYPAEIQDPDFFYDHREAGRHNLDEHGQVWDPDEQVLSTNPYTGAPGWEEDIHGDGPGDHHWRHAAAPFDFEPSQHTWDNSTTLPYNWRPQFPVDMFRDEQTQSPDHEIDAEERLHSSDSRSGERREEEHPYPGPAKHLFADFHADPLHTEPVEGGPGFTTEFDYDDPSDPNSVRTFRRDHTKKYQPGQGRHRAAGRAPLPTHNGLEGDPHELHRDWMERGEGYEHESPYWDHVHPAGLDDRYASIEPLVAHNDTIWQFKNDPYGTIERHGAIDLSAGLDSETGLDQDDLVRYATKEFKTAKWRDVAQKAYRLKREGAVHVHAMDPSAIYATVQGDHGDYEVMILRGSAYSGMSPTGHKKQAIANWKCSCDWGKWAFKRKLTFVGRLCSHGYAAYLTQQGEHMKDRHRQRTATSVDDFKSWVKDNNDDITDIDAVDGYLQDQEEPPTKEDAQKIYDYALSNHTEHEERDYDQDGYHYENDGVLRTQPHKLIPHSIEVPELSDEDRHYFTDLGDDRKTTGPDQIMAKVAKGEDKAHEHHPDFAWSTDDKDDFPEDGIVHFSSRIFTSDENQLQHLRDLSQEPPDLGNMAQHNEEVRRTVEDLRERGFDASPMVASLHRAALWRIAAPGDPDDDNTTRTNVNPGLTPAPPPGFVPPPNPAAPISGSSAGAAGPAPTAAPAPRTPPAAPPAAATPPAGGGAAPSAPAAPAAPPTAADITGGPNFGEATQNTKGNYGTGAGPNGAVGTGAGFGGAGFQTGGDWAESKETTAIHPGEYTVKPGDTASDIAGRAGTDIGNLKGLGNDPNLITPGQKLTVGPGGNPTGPTHAGGGAAAPATQAGAVGSAGAVGGAGAGGSPPSGGKAPAANTSALGDVGALKGNSPFAAKGVDLGVKGLGQPGGGNAPASKPDNSGAVPGSGGMSGPLFPNALKNYNNYSTKGAARFAMQYFAAEGDSSDQDDTSDKKNSGGTSPGGLANPAADLPSNYKSVSQGNPLHPGRAEATGNAPAPNPSVTSPTGQPNAFGTPMPTQSVTGQPTGNDNPKGSPDSTPGPGQPKKDQAPAAGGGPGGNNNGLGAGGMGAIMPGLQQAMGIAAPLIGMGESALGSLGGGLMSGLGGLMGGGLGHLLHGSTDAERFASHYFEASGDLRGEGGGDWADVPWTGSGPRRKDFMSTSEQYVEQNERTNVHDNWATDVDGDIIHDWKPAQRPKQSSRHYADGDIAGSGDAGYGMPPGPVSGGGMVSAPAGGGSYEEAPSGLGATPSMGSLSGLSTAARNFWADVERTAGPTADDATGYFGHGLRGGPGYDKGDTGLGPEFDQDQDQQQHKHHGPHLPGQGGEDDAAAEGAEGGELAGAAEELAPLLLAAGTSDGSDIVRQFQASGGGCLGAPSGGGGGQYSDDGIAKAAQRLLKTAGRHYSLAEQRELEDEGRPRAARNLGSLDLRGTHYED